MKKLIYILLTSIFITGFGITAVSAKPDKSSSDRLTFSIADILKSQNEDIEELIKNAFDLYKQKKYDEALAVCSKASQLSPTDFRPHTLAGYVYMAQWKLKSASEEFAKAIVLRPDNKQTYLIKARADQMRGAKEEALAACRKALELDPVFAEAYLTIGDTLRFDDKRRDEARAAYQSALKANPQLLGIYESLGEFLESAKDEKGAEEILRKGMAVDQKHMVGRFSLGRLLVKQGRIKEAREIWESRTADEDRTIPSFITVLERAEKLQQATEALAKEPDNPETILQMGLAVMEGDSWVVDGRQERAIVHFRKALTLKPNFAMAQYAICKAYIQMADTFKDKNKTVDEELGKLKRLDAKLAQELDEYRKTYSGGIKVDSSVKINQ